MKTYLIPIGENEELCERVQRALFAAGFERSLAGGGSATTVNDVSSGTLSLNRGGNGLFTRTSFNSRTFMSTEPSSDVLIAPSYVLAHASELDGAKKPWEIAEEGQRFVTKDERLILSSEETAARTNLRRWNEHSGDWRPPVGRWDDGRAYTVPLSFTFVPKQVEISMDEIAAWQGVDVANLKVKK